MMNPVTFYPRDAQALRPRGEAPSLNEQAARQVWEAQWRARFWALEWRFLILLAGIAFTLARRRVHAHQTT
jgi:hypothetical protein